MPRQLNSTGKSFRLEQLCDNPPRSVWLPDPDQPPQRGFVGRGELIDCCLAAWLDSVDSLPLQFRLTGPPGVGKNELVYHLARERGQELHIMHGHEELTPEDIACTARITEENQVEYVGSPLLAAMYYGGICFFDEIGKVPSRSLSLLSSGLDDRRTLTSVLGGFSIKAQPGFRFCAAMNESDSQTAGLPGYVDERLRPEFKLDYPPADELMEIVQRGLGSADAQLLEAFRSWSLEKASTNGGISPRTALAMLNYAARRVAQCGMRKLDAARARKLIAEVARIAGGSSE